ncbi:MAG: hypothetical protein NXI04_25825 [Planctomycetaceae bacterium]|nr:hypothetical protein [Planctomycetaceae bacterium]
MILKIISAALLCPVLIEYAFRCWVARRIRTVIESVPPLALTEDGPGGSGRLCETTLPDGRRGKVVVFRSTPQPVGVILFLPELDGAAQSASGYCQPLIEAGFVVVSVEFAATGDLSGDDADADGPTATPIHWTSEADLLHVEAALQFVSDHPDFCSLPWGIFGVSRGATAAIATAGRHPKIQAVITDSGYSSMGLTRSFIDRFGRQLIPEWLFDRLPGWHIRKALWAAFRLSEKARGVRYVHIECEPTATNAPALLIRGSRDSYVTAEATQQLAARLPSATTWTVKRAKHNRPRLVAPEEYREKTVSHFEHALKVDRTTEQFEQQRQDVA